VLKIDFGFLDPDPQKYADPRRRISTKNCKKSFLSKPKSEILEKEIL